MRWEGLKNGCSTDIDLKKGALDRKRGLAKLIFFHQLPKVKGPKFDG